MAHLKIAKNRKAMTIAVIMLVIIGFLSTMMISGLTSVRQMKKTKNQQIQELANSEWEYIYARINENYKGALALSNVIKKNIVSDLLAKYSDMAELNYELQNILINKDSNIVNVIGTNIKDIYYNDIKNDANDPFVMSSTNILSDLSINCSADERSRTFEEEISMHFNKMLAAQALRSIVSQDGEQVFWNFVEVKPGLPWYDDVRYMDIMNIDALKSLFLKYKNIDVLSTFEFISTSYIYEKTDITGEAVVNYSGQLNKNANQFFVNAVFNIVDVMNNNVYDSVVIQKYKEKMKGAIDDYNIRRDYTYTIMVIECFTFLITFVALTKLQHSILAKD